MADSNLLGYVGAVTGVVGAVTGIAGSVMGYISYRRSEKLKSLDLRLELRKASTALRATVHDLPTLLDKSKSSRTAVAVATGNFGSSRMKLFADEVTADQVKLKSLEAELPEPSADYAQLDHSELESKLVFIHALQTDANLLRQKYEAGLAADDKDREQIRADIRSTTQANLLRR